MNLDELGWDPRWEATFAPLALRGLVPARVVTEDKHYYTVVGRDGPMLGQVAGKFFRRRHDASTLPKVGDWIALRPESRSDRVSIEAVLERRSSITRKTAGRAGAAQILATNIDVTLVVQALDPTLSLRRIERFLVSVLEGGSRPVVVLNKADLHPDAEAAAREVRRVAGGHPVVLTSARTGLGLGRLREVMPAGSTAVVLGTSGVGKSSLVNRLLGEKALVTLPVRAWDSKGRHATTHRELVVLPHGSLVIDTPGLRELHLWLADGGLDEAFPDVQALASECRFRDCRHDLDEGCAVRQGVAEGRLPADRLQSFLKLQSELATVAERKREHEWAQNRRRVRGGNIRVQHARMASDDGAA